MQDCLKRTSAHTCTHMYKDTKADIHAHVEPFANTWLENKNRIIYIFKDKGKKMQIRVYSRPVFDKEERREEDRKRVCVCFVYASVC